MRAGERRVAHDLEVRLRAAGHHRNARRHALAAFGLDVAQDGLALEAIEARTQEQSHTAFCELLRHPGRGRGIEVTVHQRLVPMHHRHLQLRLAKTGRDLAGKQTSAYDHDHFFRLRHLAQSERVANRAQINHVAQTDPRDLRPHWPAAHCEAGFFELDRLPIPEHGQPSIDIKLRHHRAKTRLDFVRRRTSDLPGMAASSAPVSCRAGIASRASSVCRDERSRSPTSATEPFLSNLRMPSQTLLPPIPLPMMR